jgi:D-lactate dehydrogenase (cytochrome)
MVSFKSTTFRLGVYDIIDNMLYADSTFCSHHCTSFGHAGDGNFHCILPLKKNDSIEYKDKVHQVVGNMIARAMSVGGTCTGEHGVGYGKKKYLNEMYGAGGVALMESVKKAIDPWNIMNPGKIIDTDFYRRE